MSERILITMVTGVLCAAADRGDGIAEDLELRLANEYAPILFYDADEPNLPASLDRFLSTAELWFFSEYCRPQQVRIMKWADARLSDLMRPSCRVPGEVIHWQGTRSSEKKSTFYLTNVPEKERRGGEDRDAWTTYVHAYRNDLGGITLQYWRFYSYNSSYFLGSQVEFGAHGGDWEAIHVVLKPSAPDRFTPAQIRLLGHHDILTKPWNEVLVEDGHPLISCEKGGHTSGLMTGKELSERSHRIEHQSWTGGQVRWPGGKVAIFGSMAMLGQKTMPRAGMEWLRYSGLWGTRENSGWYPLYRSGYWGPAFNETGLRKGGFISAWCEGISGSGSIAIRKECYADAVVP